MAGRRTATLQDDKPYKATLPREQFLFYEMRTTAKLLCEGFSDQEAIQKICDENLFQYPTERMLKNLSGVCVSRLRALKDDGLIAAIAHRSTEVAKQICLYAMMQQNRLVRDFMITVIGEKYRLMDLSFGKMDLNVFFMRLQEQYDYIAAWSDTTIRKTKQILTKVLIENHYLDHFKADHLNPVLIETQLENVIRSNGDEVVLPAFNCLN